MVQLTQQQMATILGDDYIDTKIIQCESFLDDLDQFEDESEFARINEELNSWISLRDQMQNELG